MIDTMEIGSFIELQLPKEREYYNANKDCARLNTGRSAIAHAYLLLNQKKIWLPIYQCDSVRETLSKVDADIRYYHIDQNFNPIDIPEDTTDTVLFANYYGIMSHKRMAQLSAPFKNVIIDNSQAFFCEPVVDKMNVYSCRKFVGVPDGAYVIGPMAESGIDAYPQGYSSDTAAFLLTRIEYGCEGKGYAARKINEDRIDSEGIRRMSALTRAILDATDYEYIKQKRCDNFVYAHSLFSEINRINPLHYFDDTTIPMVYPLVVEDASLLERLQAAKHFQGHWWSYVCEEQPQSTFEHWLSKYIIPITIDQRYNHSHINYLATIINNK